MKDVLIKYYSDSQIERKRSTWPQERTACGQNANLVAKKRGIIAEVVDQRWTGGDWAINVVAGNRIIVVE